MKNFMGFLYMKYYSKFWSISLENFIEHKAFFLKSGHLGTYIENTSRDDPLVEVTRGQIE